MAVFTNGGTTNQPFISSGGGKFLDNFSYADLDSAAPIDPTTGTRLYKITSISSIVGGTGTSIAGIWNSPGVRYDTQTITLNGVTASASSATATVSAAINATITGNGGTYYAGYYSATSLAMKRDTATGSFSSYTGTPSTSTTLGTTYNPGNLYFQLTWFSLPNQPTSVTLTNITSTSMTVNWTAPSSNGGSAITGYKIQYQLSSDNGTTWGAMNTWIEDTASTSTSYAVTGLKPATTYRFQVAAKNIASTAYTDANGNTIVGADSSGPFSTVSANTRTKGGIYNASLGYYVPMNVQVMRGTASFTSGQVPSVSASGQLTFSTKPDIQAGDSITISGTGNGTYFDGTHTVLAVTSVSPWVVTFGTNFNSLGSAVTVGSGTTKTWRPGNIKVYNAGWQTFI